MFLYVTRGEDDGDWGLVDVQHADGKFLRHLRNSKKGLFYNIIPFNHTVKQGACVFQWCTGVGTGAPVRTDKKGGNGR